MKFSPPGEPRFQPATTPSGRNHIPVVPSLPPKSAFLPFPLDSSSPNPTIHQIGKTSHALLRPHLHPPGRQNPQPGHLHLGTPLHPLRRRPRNPMPARHLQKMRTHGLPPRPPQQSRLLHRKIRLRNVPQGYPRIQIRPPMGLPNRPLARPREIFGEIPNLSR